MKVSIDGRQDDYANTKGYQDSNCQQDAGCDVKSHDLRSRRKHLLSLST